MGKAFVIFALITSLGASLKADTLAKYQFDNTSRSSSGNSANLTASTFADGPGWTSTIDSKRGNGADSISVTSMLTTGGTEAAAVTAGDYFSFTITPNAGMGLDLSSLSFDFANFTNQTGPGKKFPVENFFVRSSLDNFTTDLAAEFTAPKNSKGKFSTANITLGPEFDDLSSGVEFRIFVQDDVSKANRGALVDNVSLSGTTFDASQVQVPEPATWMLMGVGLLIGAQRLRRKG